jgi:hypothetical protein
MELMTRETSPRASTRTYSCVAAASVEASARVTRIASRCKFSTGVRDALPISPASTVCHSAPWSLRQRLGSSSRSSWSILTDKIASVSFGSHSRFWGDWKMSGTMITNRTSTEKMAK